MMRLKENPPTEEEITKVIEKFEEIVCSKCDLEDECDKFPLQKFVCCYVYLRRKTEGGM